MHTKTAVLNRLGSLLVLTRDVNSKVFQAEEWSSRSQTIVVNMCANASDRLANTAVEKAIVHKNLGKERSVLYIHGSLGCSNTLPHRSKSFELLRMMLPRIRVGNFGVKKISLPDGFYENFVTRKDIT